MEPPAGAHIVPGRPCHRNKKGRGARERDARIVLERVTAALASVGVPPADDHPAWQQVTRDLGKFVDAGTPCTATLEVRAARMSISYRLSARRGVAPQVDVRRPRL